MKLIRIFLLLSLSFPCYSQSTENKITIGNTDSLYSNILKETRKIWVYVPSEGAVFSHQHYPVVYLLDAESHFNSVVGMIQYLSEVYDNTVCPKMIVVGITNTDRTRDFTPSNITASYYGSFPTSGGSEYFTQFLQNELIPYVDAHYPTAPYRTLIGHSFAGLLTVTTLANHPDLFNAYVAIDPSLWWDNQKILKQAEKILVKKNSLVGKSLYLAVANTVGPHANTALVIKDTSGMDSHMRANLLFGNFVTKNPGSGLHSQWKYYGNDNHGSVPLIAEYDALRFLFDYYQLPEENFELMTAAIFENHYKDISAKLGYKVLPPEALINNQGYVWLQRNIFDKAYAYFKLNIDSYPNSSNVYDSMADYYIAIKNVKKAIEYLKKELTLNDAPEVREKLKKIENQK